MIKYINLIACKGKTQEYACSLKLCVFCIIIVNTPFFSIQSLFVTEYSKEVANNCITKLIDKDFIR